jgi:uncharacterized coiled-coil protein SlyX
MTTFKHRFLTQLEEYKIALDEDTIDYLGGMLTELSLHPDIDEVRSSTEAFLEDADVNSSTIDSFYQKLTDQSTASTASQNNQVKQPVVSEPTTPPPPSSSSVPIPKVQPSTSPATSDQEADDSKNRKVMMMLTFHFLYGHQLNVCSFFLSPLKHIGLK